jgi:hypothetical protein
MDQRSIILYLSAEKMSAQMIYMDLVAAIWYEIIVYSIVTIYLRNINYHHCTDGTSNNQENQMLDEANELILIALFE